MREEGFNILKSALGNITKETVGGISDVNFPKQSGTGGNASAVVTSGGSVNTRSTVYQDKIQQLQGNGGSSGTLRESILGGNGMDRIFA